MNNKEEKSILYGERMSALIIGATLLFSFIVAFTCKALTNDTDSTKTTSDMKVARNQAEEYYFNRQYDKAIAEYEKDGEGQEWPMYKVKMAEVYSVMGDTDKSSNLLEESVINRYDLLDNNKMSEYKDQDRELTNMVVYTFFMNKEYQKALEYGELFLNEDKKNTKLQRTMLAIYMSNEKVDKAKEIVKNYDLDKKSSYDLALYARMNMIVGDFDAGFEYLKEAWNLNKDEIKVFDVISQITAYDNVDIVKKLVKLEKDNPQEMCYKAWLAKYYSMTEKTASEAKKYLDELKEKKIDGIPLKIIESKIYQYENKNIEAENIINDIINSNKDSYIGYHAAAWYYEELGNYNKAMNYCSKSIALNRDYPDNYIFLALDIFSNMKDKEMAEPYIRLGLEEEPFNYSILIKIADYYANQIKDFDKAYDYYYKAGIIKPDEPEIYYNMAKLDMSQKKYEEALEEMKKCVELNNSSVVYHRMLGSIYLNLDNKKESINEIRKAYSLDKNDIKTLNNAGCYYISFESNISRGLINLKAAYEGINDNTDEETKTIIRDNYDKAKLLYEQYSNFDGQDIPIPTFELFN